MEVFGKNEDSFMKGGNSSIRFASAFRGRARATSFREVKEGDKRYGIETNKSTGLCSNTRAG
jgi:hypothetical protein